MFLQRYYKHIIIEITNKFFSNFILSALAAPSLQFFGSKIGKNVRIYTPLILHNTKFKNLTIGNNCHIGRDVFFDLYNEVFIEDHVTISMRCMLITHIDVGDSPLKKYGYRNCSGKITIHNGVYIGAGTIILHGVEIGHDSLVGAGTLVNKDIPPYSLVVGVPGRIVKRLDHKSTLPIGEPTQGEG